MKFFLRITLCLFLTTLISCQSEEIQESESAFLKTEVLYLDGKKIEIDTYTDANGIVSIGEESKVIINSFLEANPNYSSLILSNDNAIRIFKNDNDKDKFKSSIGYKVNNDIFHSKAEAFIEDGPIDGGPIGGGSSSFPLLNVKMYEHINNVGLLDDWTIYHTSLNSRRRYFSYLNTNNMNDKISSFVVNKMVGANFNGVSLFIYKDDIGSTTDREFLIHVNDMPYIVSNLSWYWMSGTEHGGRNHGMIRLALIK
ncbi:hypothetical protein [Polaribacter sp. M15]